MSLEAFFATTTGRVALGISVFGVFVVAMHLIQDWTDKRTKETEP